MTPAASTCCSGEGAKMFNEMRFLTIIATLDSMHRPTPSTPHEEVHL